MHLKRLELNGFKSFAKKSEFVFDASIIAIVGPNGSGKSNIVEAIRFVLGEQSVKSMRGKTGSDLIFKGSKNISKMSRATVTIIFDNTDRVFHLHHHNNAKINIDFDEVSIAREVYVDGGNKYMINGHEVRMKDIHELIASVNIGASGHHIISQGEADRYLNANVRDRRELIEEALGLKVFQYRLKESLRKLDKSEANMRESEILRRELAPHLRFLKRQVDKIEKAKYLRADLLLKYQDYFGKEDYVINHTQTKVTQEKETLHQKMNSVSEFLNDNNNPSEKNIVYPQESLIFEKQQFIADWQKKIAENTRELGKVEGMTSLLEKQSESSKKPDIKKEHPGFAYTEVKTFLAKIFGLLKLVNPGNINNIVSQVEGELNSFMKQESVQPRIVVDNNSEIAELERKKEILVLANREASEYIAGLENETLELKQAIVLQQQQERESQKQYYEHVALKKEVDGKYELLQNHIESLQKRIQERDEEYTEGCVLLGVQDVTYQALVLGEDNTEVSLALQEQSRRDIERIKIRLEDMGGGSGGEVIREYEETMERDGFLEKEITDVTETIQSLQGIINDLKQTLNTKFDAGVEKINVQFDRFFKLMFGGGSAKLEASLIKKRRKKIEGEQMELLPDEEDEKEKEYGIDIQVQLPRKKVTDLEMLSGGERSLTSIALLFALSQVNPPPFLVLDETDAALDEANSQKYGDMIESLSEFSQLVVVTHNRETMSRAQTLFGVTLGRDDASTLLSLRLEDAEKYAK